MAPSFELNLIDAVTFRKLGDLISGVRFVHWTFRRQDIIGHCPQLPITIVLDPLGSTRPLQLTIVFRVARDLSCRVELFLRCHIGTPNYRGQCEELREAVRRSAVGSSLRHTSTYFDRYWNVVERVTDIPEWNDAPSCDGQENLKLVFASVGRDS